MYVHCFWVESSLYGAVRVAAVGFTNSVALGLSSCEELPVSEAISRVHIPLELGLRHSGEKKFGCANECLRIHRWGG